MGRPSARLLLCRSACDWSSPVNKNFDVYTNSVRECQIKNPFCLQASHYWKRLLMRLLAKRSAAGAAAVQSGSNRSLVQVMRQGWIWKQGRSEQERSPARFFYVSMSQMRCSWRFARIKYLHIVALRDKYALTISMPSGASCLMWVINHAGCVITASGVFSLSFLE
jgi:hypothetical protein